MKRPPRGPRSSLPRLGPVLLGIGLLGPGPLACNGAPYGRKAPPAAKQAPQTANPPAKPPTAAAKTKAPKAAPKKDSPNQRTKGVPKAHDDGKPLGKILPTAPLPLTKLLGQTPVDAQAFLGPPLPDSKGGMRDSCVRYLPERTWFHCKFAWQRYSDKTGTFDVVHLTFEDGKVSGVAFENIPGSGQFDPRQALRSVGLDLPGKPKVETPQTDVTIWNWWNSRARLIVHGRQYRIRVSTVKNTWDSAKVEIILNDPLSESEKARVFDEDAEG